MPAPDKDTPGVIAFPPLIYGAGIVAGLVLHQLWPLPVLPADHPAGLRYALAGAPIAAALALVVWALPQFRRLGTSVSVHQPSTALITTGPYRFTRNPLYLALALIQAGIAVAADQLWIAVLLLPALLVVRSGVIAREERYLERKFGQPYRDYCARVRRWL